MGNQLIKDVNCIERGIKAVGISFFPGDLEKASHKGFWNWALVV